MTYSHALGLALGARPSGVLIAALAALAASPVLAAWAVALCRDVQHRWWRPRGVSARRWLSITIVAVALGGLAGLSSPWPAWWLFATAGTVLAVVDARVRLLPSRLLYPLASAEAITLLLVALIEHDLARLERAVLAAAIAGAFWFACVFVSPDALGLGDVRLAALGAGLLGWHGWRQVVDGQLAIWMFALVFAAGLAAIGRTSQVRGMLIPLGPPLILAPLLVGAW